MTKILYVIFVSPILISFLFVHEMTGSPFMQFTGADELTWQSIRLVLVIFFVGLRMLSLREELQNTFNQSYTLIVKLMQDKDERLFKYVQARITQSF